MTLSLEAANLGVVQSIHEGLDNNLWLYCEKPWLKASRVKTGAHAGLLHQGPWKASYAPDTRSH